MKGRSPRSCSNSWSVTRAGMFLHTAASEQPSASRVCCLALLSFILLGTIVSAINLITRGSIWVTNSIDIYWYLNPSDRTSLNWRLSVIPAGVCRKIHKGKFKIQENNTQKRQNKQCHWISKRHPPQKNQHNRGLADELFSVIRTGGGCRHPCGRWLPFHRLWRRSCRPLSRQPLAAVRLRARQPWPAVIRNWIVLQGFGAAEIALLRHCCDSIFFNRPSKERLATSFFLPLSPPYERLRLLLLLPSAEVRWDADVQSGFRRWEKKESGYEWPTASEREGVGVAVGVGGPAVSAPVFFEPVEISCRLKAWVCVFF